MKGNDDLCRKSISSEGLEGQDKEEEEALEEEEDQREEEAGRKDYHDRFKTKYSLIIRDLSFHCNEGDLYKLLENSSSSSCILRITIQRNRRDRRSLLHGFVDCNEEEGRNQLIERFHGHKFMGRRIKLEACDANQEKLPASEAPPTKFQLHVRYKSLSSEAHLRITEEVLEKECIVFGEIVDIVIKRHSESLDYSTSSSSLVSDQRGYAFIYYEGFEGVQKAVMSSPLMLFGGQVRCDLSYSHQTEDILHSNERHHQVPSFAPSFPTPTPTPFPVSINTTNVIVSPPLVYNIFPSLMPQSYGLPLSPQLSPTQTPFRGPYYPLNSPTYHYYHPRSFSTSTSQHAINHYYQPPPPPQPTINPSSFPGSTKHKQKRKSSQKQVNNMRSL